MPSWCSSRPARVRPQPRAPIAAHVNSTIHLDNGGRQQISADMPATIYSLLAMVKGPEMVTAYSTRCCGDINHIDVKRAASGGATRTRRGWAWSSPTP